MKSINNSTLLDLLQNDVRAIILQANKLKLLPAEVLQQQPGKDKWSVAQVMQHLNFYCRHYITAIENKLHYFEGPADAEFKPGWLGNYFTKLMQPTANNSIAKKMKAPKNATPSHSPDVAKELEEFIHHQHHLLNILNIARKADLNKIKVPTSISSIIKLKLGDTFRFLIAHEQRHFIQVKNILDVTKHASVVENSH